jgi:hypothetical protein
MFGKPSNGHASPTDDSRAFSTFDTVIGVTPALPATSRMVTVQCRRCIMCDRRSPGRRAARRIPFDRVKVARGGVASANPVEVRLFEATPFHGCVTANVNRTAHREVKKARHLAADHRRAAAAGNRSRHRTQQSLCVRMRWTAVKRVAGCKLNDGTAIHHRYPLRNVATTARSCAMKR